MRNYLEERIYVVSGRLKAKPRDTVKLSCPQSTKTFMLAQGYLLRGAVQK
jgi:hypothetical protein